MSRPADSRHQRAASSGSSQAANGTGRLPCLRREKRSSSAAATVSPSMTRAAAGSWNNALIPRTFTLVPPVSHTGRRFVPTSLLDKPLIREKCFSRCQVLLGSREHERPGRGNRAAVRISVIGTGYLGATHAACLAECGHEVVGIDSDPRKVDRLAAGSAPFHEPRLDDLLRRGVGSGALTFHTDSSRASGAEVHFLCVGTPQQAGSHAADLSALDAAVGSLAPWLTGPCLVVGKSTVPVGTARRLAERLAAQAPGRERVRTAWNPEFLREGHAVEDSLRPDRLVFGVQDDESDQVLRDVYAPMINAGVPVVRTDLETAELAKVSANVMLATRISLVNLLAEVCEAADADVGDLTAVLGLDRRIGSEFLNPGVGYGGGGPPPDTPAGGGRAPGRPAGGPGGGGGGGGAAHHKP